MMSGGIAALVLHPGDTCHWTNLGSYGNVEKAHDKDEGGWRPEGGGAGGECSWPLGGGYIE